MILKWVFVIFFFCTRTSGIKQCCPENSTLTPSGCSNGSKLNLDCPLRFFLPMEDYQMLQDMEGNLLLDDEIIPEDEYCASQGSNESHLNDSMNSMIVVCYEEDEAAAAPLFLTILACISVVFLVVTVIIYLLTPAVMNLQGICIVHSISGLAMSFLTLSINQLAVITSPKECVFLGNIMYVSFLYAFFWLNIMTFHIWRTTVEPKFLSRIKTKWIILYHVYGILGPTVFLCLLILGHNMKPHSLDPGFGEGTCWFKSLETQFAYMYGPIAALLSINIIFYIWTVAFLWNEMATHNEKKKKILMYRFKLCLKLFFIMGISWIFEILSASITHKSMRSVWLVTDAINASEGVLIFLILVVFRKKVVRAIANKSAFERIFPNEWRTMKDEESSESCEMIPESP